VVQDLRPSSQFVSSCDETQRSIAIVATISFQLCNKRNNFIGQESSFRYAAEFVGYGLLKTYT
jgi:hypothetical protein